MAQARQQVWPMPAENKVAPKESKASRFLNGAITVMAENGRLTIPYPVLALVVGLILTLLAQTGAGIWWASSMTEKMQSLRDLQGIREQQHLDQMKRLEGTLDEQRIWIQTTRERLAKIEMEGGRRR